MFSFCFGSHVQLREEVATPPILGLQKSQFHLNFGKILTKFNTVLINNI